MVAHSRAENPGAVAPFLENLVNALDRRDASPIQVAGIDGDVISFSNYLHAADDRRLRARVPREANVSSGFLRKTTTICLAGGGHEGEGEDVSYEGEDQDAMRRAGASQPLAGTWTLGSFCEHVEGLDLWPEPARHAASVQYRMWAYESAALDLALRQAGTTLHGLLGRELRPVTFVCSKRLAGPDEPSDLQPLLTVLERYPTLRFKLDPQPDWDAALIERLLATGAVDSLDFKGLYEGTAVDTPADPEYYLRIAEGFPDAWLEDPQAHARDRRGARAPPRPHHLGRADPFGRRHRRAVVPPTHGERQAVPRSGPCATSSTPTTPAPSAGSACTAAGSSSSARAAGSIQYLASLFHPDGPNDVAPTGYNEPLPPDGLPASPLAVAAHDLGMRWG